MVTGKEVFIMNKFINYFFEEEEKELIETYGYLLKLAIITVLFIILGVFA